MRKFASNVTKDAHDLRHIFIAHYSHTQRNVRQAVLFIKNNFVIGRFEEAQN